MDIEKCKNIIIEAIDDVKGTNVKCFDTTKNTFLFDHIIIATIESTRQANAILKRILDKKFNIRSNSYFFISRKIYFDSKKITKSSRPKFLI